MASRLAGAAWYAFRMSFGLASLAAIWLSATINTGSLWARDSKQEKQEIAAAQDKYWNLDKAPLPGFRHAFFKTTTGARLHYVVNATTESRTSKNVLLFIHGYPDSFLLWRHILQSPELSRNNILVAVDLPGYGGSDSLHAYGPNEVLEAITEYVVEMRQLFLQDNKKIVIVTHDWGAIIGARLASEAKELADHFIVTSAIVPRLTASNARNKVLLAKQMLHTWIRSPLNFRLLRNSLHALDPVLSQFKCSFYIFCFLLPWPLSNFFSTFGNYWFLRVLHDLHKGKRSKKDGSQSRLTPPEVGDAMAMSIGPGIPQIDPASQSGDRYGESVRKRNGDRGMSEKMELYRQNLFIGKWEKSLEMTAALYEIGTENESRHSSSGSLLSDTAPKGSFKAPTTVLYGEFDVAFDRRLALDNIRDYLTKGSQVVIVKGAGHWIPIESIGRRVLEKTISWALQNDDAKSGANSSPFASMSDVRVLEEM